MNIIKKFFEWSDNKQTAVIAKEMYEYVNTSPMFKEQLDAAKAAIDAFSKSKKDPEDMQNFFAVLYTAVKYCYFGLSVAQKTRPNSELLQMSVEKEMYHRICKLIMPEEP